jgi:hypothetical protein
MDRRKHYAGEDVMFILLRKTLDTRKVQSMSTVLEYCRSLLSSSSLVHR